MNTVCPGFVPHHVKPNRCRRCFKDIHDHDSEVTTSFTLPLPRRRRESVTVAETPKSEEVEATFTISEATSSGRRMRQRSSSTSSWFQEKKVDEEHKERIDTLFRNADDSRASYNSKREDDDQPDTVAVVRMPPTVRRRQGEDVDVKGDPRSLLTRLSEVRKTNDVSAKPPELPPKTLDSLKLKKSDLLKRSDADSGKRLAENGQKLPDSGQILADSKPSWTRHGTQLSGKSTDSRFDPVRRAGTKVGDKDGDNQLSCGTLGKFEISSRNSDSRLDPVKKPDATLEAKEADKRSGDGKFSGSRFGTGKSDLSSSSYLKSKFEPEAVSKAEDGKVSNEKPPDSKLDEKKTTSKFGEVKLKDTKFGEVKLRDTKVSELRSRASKFESTTSKTTKEPSKIAAEEKPAESKPEPKPVLARFSSLRSLDTKTSPVAAVAKTADKNAASRESTRLGEGVSESSKDSAETSKSKPSAVTEEQKPKPIEVRNSTLKDKPKAEIPNAEEVQQTQGQQQQQWESRVAELQSSVSQLRRRLEESEDACSMLERERTDLQKQQKDRLEQDRQALEKTAGELAKVRAKLAEMQTSQDLARKTKQELKDAKEDLNRKEAEWNKKEAEWKRKESELSQREPPETKLNVEQLKQELKDAKAELNRKEAEWSQRESELSRKEPATRQSVDQLKKDLREAKSELSKKEAEWNKKDIEWSKKESEWSKAKAELSKSVSGPIQNVEQLKQELKDAKAELNKKEAEWSKKEAEWSKKEPLTKLNSVEDVKKELREAKAEMSKKESEWRKREIELNKKEIELKKKEAEWTKKEAEWNRKESEYMKREPAAKLSVEQLKKELKDAKAELNRKEAEWSRRGDSGPPKLGTDQLKQKLAQSEALCEELAEENEEIKKEVRDLEQELEELHDNFREDQASEFRGLKRELEGATKNCRVLQFKLRKAEKKGELLEVDRHALEDKVREYQAAVRQDVDRSKFKELEQELGMQRSLASSLHEEVEVLKEALTRAEAEKMAPRSATPVTQSLLPGHFREGLLGKDYEALSHELFDTMEREGDLREQLRFSEEEARSARRKTSALEQENETLVLQIKKLTAIVKARAPSATTKGRTLLKGEEAEEETSSEELKMQLELQEQELSVVRRKLDDAEREAENLQSEVKYLQEKVINQPLVEVPELPKEKESGGGAYWEHKARQQDYEMRETRRRLIEKDREIERLHTEVEVHRRKAARMMVRSRSLDSDLQVDLKRQLQLVEQEAGMLRQKVSSLEAESDKLGAENKRMTLRLSKKAPPSSAELLQLDNLELKEKMEEQQRKLEALMEKTRADSNPVTVIQDYKPLKESLSSLLSENESDLIGSLRRNLRSREEEQAALQGRAAQLQAENGRLSREFRRLKESLAERRRPPAKAVREAATRVELREVVGELQDEISDLQVNLRSREVLQEGLEEEVERARKELREALQQKEEKLGVELEAARSEKEALKKELEDQRSRTVSAEEALKTGGRAGTGVEQAKRISTLSQEKREAERRAAAAEEALALRTQRLREAQEALAAASSLREDLARSNRSLEAQKADVEKELEEHRNLLTKAEGRAAELRSQVDKTDRDLTSLRKECNQLRNELEDERGRLKQSSDRKQSEASSGWSREREGLRRIENELRNRIEHLQHQVTDNEKIWIEKESRMRDDFKKKKEGAVREAREKGEAALELVKEEEKILRGRAQELADKLGKLEGSLKEATEKSRHLVSQHRRDKEEWQAEKDGLEASARSEQKRRERLEREQEQALATKEEELLRSRERLVAMEREQRRNQMQIEEVDSLQQKVRQMEKEADKARAEYDLITSKYDQLEDEFVKTKASLVADKELTETNLLCLKRDYNELSFELTSLKGTYNARQDNWIKEKLDLQERLKELTRRMERLKLVEQERRRLQDAVEEKEAFVQTFKKEEKQLKDEREKLGKRVEELTKMLVAQQAGPASPSSGAGDPGGRRRPDELEATRRDYEARMAIMASEISSMQAQIGALAAERDDLRAQLSSAERSAEEVRSGSLKRERARHREEADAARRKVHELRFQLEDLREQLEDAQLENRNLRLQIETDKNTFDFQAAELKSKINQLEEQKILESTRGQTRNIAKTRLELAWEKERSELQLLLAESHRLGVELKERVQSGDGERDRERQAVRKQMLEMRSATEKERQESKRKMTELHSSLLEIRESHAKLRGMYDRMKKERELLLKEREEWRQRLQAAAQLHAAIARLAQDFDKVTSQVSDNSGKTPLNADLKESVQKVKESFVELQTSAAALKEDEKLKRTTSFRRAVSAQEVNRPGDPLGRWQNPQRVTDYPLAPPSMILRPPPRQKALQRKSLSLDQALSQEQRLKIWESEGESACSTPGGGSLLSLGGYGYETDSSLPDSEYRYGGVGRERRQYRPPSAMTTDSEAMSSREGSVDPGGSVESVPLQHQRRTLKDKLKLLRRTKSIDVASGRKEEPSRGGKVEKEMSLRSKISKVLRMGRTDGQRPALPPRGATPEVVPRRPTAEKPLSASRGDLSAAKTTDSASKSAAKTTDSASKSAAKTTDSASKSAKKARETPV